MKHIYIFLLLSVASARNIGTFLQLTDIHFDQFYQPGSPTNCSLGDTGMGCCRVNSVPLEPYNNASVWGDYNCDMPLLFVDESLKWISQNVNPPDFIIWNGDNVDHHDVSQDLPNNVMEINITTQLISKYFGSNRIFPMLGNHDTGIVDQLWYDFSKTELSNDLSDLWVNMIPDDQKTTFANGGYYIANISNNVRLIIINSLLYDKNNMFSYMVDDPSNQNAWLADTLDDCRKNNLNVWIAGHIPIGSGEAKINFTDYFYDLTVEYSDIIKYQFWGHTHEDYYYLMLDNNKPVGFSFVAPSIMANHRFSSFREYIYDRDTLEIIDYNQYAANLTTIINNNQMSYDLYYTASNAYGLSSFTPISYYDLFEHLSANTSLIQEYHERYDPGFNNYICDLECQHDYLCEIIDIRHQAC